MNGVLDIFTKLIIAIISFIAPVIVFMLGIFTEGIPIVKRRSEEESRQIKKILQMSFSNQKITSKIILENMKQLKKVERVNADRIKLLTPKRQILRIFITLMFSLLFLMCYHLVKDPVFNLYKPWLAIGLLIGSFISFILGGLILVQIAWAVIDTKQMIANDKAAVSVLPMLTNVTETKNGETIDAKNVL